MEEYTSRTLAPVIRSGKDLLIIPKFQPSALPLILTLLYLGVGMVWGIRNQMLPVLLTLINHHPYQFMSPPPAPVLRRLLLLSRCPLDGKR